MLVTIMIKKAIQLSEDVYISGTVVDVNVTASPYRRVLLAWPLCHGRARRAGAAESPFLKTTRAMAGCGALSPSRPPDSLPPRWLSAQHGLGSINLPLGDR